MLLGHRYYDPSTGRFLTRDPIKDGRNWYAYGAGDLAPTLFADPDGLQIVAIAAATSRQGPPPVPVPGTQNGKWRWNPDPRNRRGGTWGPAKRLPGQSQPAASLEERKPGRPGVTHWDIDDGRGNRTRCDRWGRPLTVDQAHGRTPLPPLYRIPPVIPRVLPPSSPFFFPFITKPWPGLPIFGDDIWI